MNYTREYLLQLIEGEVQESGQLEYKRNQSLGKADKQKSEITKDVSAFANAAGGVIFFGIAEFDDKSKRHLPERIDPVDRSQISKEWLDQICGLIQPPIAGLRIVPVEVGPESFHVCYVVEIPAGETAHQAIDCRYYRRRNFESTPMTDYEIREVMDRQKHPQLDAAVSIHRDEETRRHHVAIRIRNVSRVMAKNYAIRLLFPLRINSERVRPTEKTPLLSGEDGSWVWDIRFDNSGGGPLFPSDEVVRVAEFERIDSMRPERDSTITEIRLTIFADQMQPVQLTKDMSAAHESWA